jgi:molybdopterin/thiamine biosynthesis adenylyltransferase
MQTNQHDAQQLSDEELEFYSRQIVLRNIGYDGQLRLRSATVCVAGVGGLGSVAAMQLAAMGVGHLRLVDYDVVERSNLQRQHLYDVSAIGYPKVEIAARRLSEMNPHVEIEPLPLAIAAHNAVEIIEGADVVVDGLDRMSPRYAVNRACLELGVPYVFGAAVSMYGNTATILPHETACLECFQGFTDDDALPSCATLGVHPSIIGLIASIEVAETTRILLGQTPRLANKLLYCDLEAMEFEQLTLSIAPSCPACGSGPSPNLPAPEHALTTELCSRDGRRTFAILPRRNLDLDMRQARGVLIESGLRVTITARLGLTFQWGTSGQASLLSSGILIVQGARDESEAYNLYHRLVVEGLGIPSPDENEPEETTPPQKGTAG